MSLNTKEIRVLKLINQNVSGQNRKKAFSYLRTELGFPNDVATKVSDLWFLNYREDGKYEEIEEVNRETQPILNFLKKIQKDEMDEDDIPERFFDDISLCRGTFNRYSYRDSWNTPCISIDADNVTFRLGSNYFDFTEITGIHEDDSWMRSEAYSSYSDYYEEYDSDEFNYFHFNDETLNLIKKIAIITKNNEVVDYLQSNKSPQSEDLNVYLKYMLPQDFYDSMVDDYLYTIGYLSVNVKRAAIRDYYEREATYQLDESDGYAIEIPIEDVIEKIEGESVLTFGDLLGIEMQKPLNFEDVWFDSGYWQSDSTEHVDDLNNKLERFVDEMDDGKYDEWVEGKEYFENILNNFNVKPTYSTSNMYTNQDGRLAFNLRDVDYINKKIKFRYDNQSHIISFDDFVPWLQGSVLGLKNESVRYGRVLIMEEKQKINKISIFDFDGTLADTPNKEDGIALWETKNKKDYPHRGWWGKPESLDENTFNVKLIPTTKDDYDTESESDNTLMVMLTGRIPKLANQVESILNKNGVIFDEYHYKEKGDTFTSKINTIKRLIEQNPNVKEIEMWEDRLNHADGFEQWGSENGIDIKVNRVTI